MLQKKHGMIYSFGMKLNSMVIFATETLFVFMIKTACMNMNSSLIYVFELF